MKTVQSSYKEASNLVVEACKACQTSQDRTTMVGLVLNNEDTTVAFEGDGAALLEAYKRLTRELVAMFATSIPVEEVIDKVKESGALGVIDGVIKHGQRAKKGDVNK
ncbi:hypothetical protein [Paenilisteria newyorkensis]|uniref:hypothetical protein n=1 Tax=Listeria newyorkensis TaxID=1497681 RepID=UPI000669B739|nr:hypothetical protein [Listeria newyorkensis]KMT62694.1 hypothetical protein X559_0977 [Listeria newyorkensis]